MLREDGELPNISSHQWLVLCILFHLAMLGITMKRKQKTGPPLLLNATTFILFARFFTLSSHKPSQFMCFFFFLPVSGHRITQLLEWLVLTEGNFLFASQGCGGTSL